MMRAVTRDSTKISAVSAVHIMRNNLHSLYLEASGTGFMPAMESKRGKPWLVYDVTLAVQVMQHIGFRHHHACPAHCTPTKLQLLLQDDMVFIDV